MTKDPHMAQCPSRTRSCERRKPRTVVCEEVEGDEHSGHPTTSPTMKLLGKTIRYSLNPAKYFSYTEGAKSPEQGSVPPVALPSTASFKNVARAFGRSCPSPKRPQSKKKRAYRRVYLACAPKYARWSRHAYNHFLCCLRAKAVPTSFWRSDSRRGTLFITPN